MIHEFAGKFEKAWLEPTPQKLASLLHDDVVLYQPTKPPIRGKETAFKDFKRLFEWLPGLYGVIGKSSGTNEFVFIEWQLKVPIGNKIFSIPAIDKFLLRNGLGIERTVYFDQLILVSVVCSHPRLWRGFINYRFGR